MTRATGRSRLAFGATVVVLVATGVGAVLTYVETPLQPSTSAAGDRYGIGVAVSGPVAVIGAHGDDTNATNAGAIWISERGPAGWSAPVTVRGTQFDGEFGEAVAVSGTTVLVGAADESAGDTRSGAAYVIVKNGPSWLEEAMLVPSDPGRLRHFGFSVAIDGDTAVVGAIGQEEVDFAGAVYVFERSNGVWSQVALLPAPSAHRGDEFGWRVAIDGDRLAVSARLEQPVGVVYVFQGGGSSWTQEARVELPRPNLGSDCCFGDALALSGDTLVVGTEYKDPVGGVAHVFRRNGSSWTEEAELTALDTDQNFFAGRSVAIDGDTLVVGADGFDQAVPNQGGAYVYTRTGTTWTAEGRIQPSDGLSGDGFGSSVSISGDTIVAGAIERAASRGAAYVFELGSGDSDVDGDGIENPVDTSPGTPSDAFSDVPLGGSTTGTITDRAGLDVSIAEAGSPGGVLAGASGVGGVATVEACGVDVFLSAGDGALLTCGSLTMEVVSGPIEAAFEGPGGMATVSVGAGNAIIIDAEAFRVTADPGNPDTIVVMVGDASVEVPPGETVPLPGAPTTTTTTATSTTMPGGSSTTTTTTPGTTTTTRPADCEALDVQCGVDRTRGVLSGLTCTRRCRCQRLERGIAKIERKLEQATGASKEKKCLRKLRQTDKAAGKLERKTAKTLGKEGCAEPVEAADALGEAVAALAAQTEALLQTDACGRP